MRSFLGVGARGHEPAARGEPAALDDRRRAIAELGEALHPETIEPFAHPA